MQNMSSEFCTAGISRRQGHQSCLDVCTYEEVAQGPAYRDQEQEAFLDGVELCIIFFLNLSLTWTSSPSASFHRPWFWYMNARLFLIGSSAMLWGNFNVF